MPIMQREIDQATAEYIRQNRDNDYRTVLAMDGRKEIYARLGDIALGQVAWYPFQGEHLLQIGSDYGAATGYLCQRCKEVTVIEFDTEVAESVRTRWSSIDNLSVICQENFWEEKEVELSVQYDAIVYALNPEIEDIAKLEDYCIRLKKIKKLLKEEGVLILTVPNRLGSKYLCGAPCMVTGIPFDGIIQNEADIYIPNKSEIVNILEEAGYHDLEMHYPYPDGRIVQMLYSDVQKPGREIAERGASLITDATTLVLDEKAILKEFSENTDITTFCNSFIIECRLKKVKKDTVRYAAISAGRIRENAFVTEVLTNDTVIKRPLFEEGKKWLERMSQNLSELQNRGISTVQVTLCDGAANMQYIHDSTLSDHIREIVEQEDIEELIEILDELYKQIMQSSEVIEEKENDAILKKAYIEMIPVNCFWYKDHFLFFDQEYTEENCSAGFVMFRAINDIYSFVPETEKIISRSKMMDRYNLTDKISLYIEKELAFEAKISQKKLYQNIQKWEHTEIKEIKNHRRVLQMADNTVRLFDPIYGLGDKKLILFGSGKMADHFYNFYGAAYQPEIILDNDQTKWGTKKKGVEICNPEDVLRFQKESYRIVIAVGNYIEIMRQLQRMGIDQKDYRIFNRTFCEEYMPYVTSENNMLEGKYNIGYVTGVFDLFHIGHLNLLKKSKERCHYLIAGVLTDELAAQDKGTRPIIPYEERAELVRQCKYVDRVIPIDLHNTDKMAAWKELHYGCLFSGSDHQKEVHWIHIQEQLRSVGSNLEFFPYTERTSSTLLKHALRGEKATTNRFPYVQECSISLGPQIDIEKPKNEIEKMAAAGYKSAEIDLAALIPENMLETIGEENAREKKDYAATVFQMISKDPEYLWQFTEVFDRYIKLSQMNVSMVKAPHLKIDSKRSDLLELLYELINQSIQICSKVGSRILIIPFLFGSDDLGKYQRIVEAAITNNVLLLFENKCKDYNGHFVRGEFSDPFEAKKLLDKINDLAGKNCCGLCLDIAVLNACGQDPYNYIMAMKQYIRAVRLRDSGSILLGSNIPFGINQKGLCTTDWRGVFRGLRQIAYHGIMVMDVSDTIQAYPYILRDEILQLSAKTAGYIEWQIGLEQKIMKYKNIVLFGAGRMCINYLDNYGEKYPPLFTCDNNSELWGTDVRGLPVKNPDMLKEIPEGTGVFICNMYYEEIRNQLTDMGIQNLEFYNDEFSDRYPWREQI